MTSRTHKPIASFGPELLSALVEGSRREIVVNTIYRKAVRFRQRAYELRSTMHATKHDLYPLVVKTRVQIIWPPDTRVTKTSSNNSVPVDRSVPVKLIFSPSDSEFADALTSAGVTIRDISNDPIVAPLPDTGPDPLEQYLVTPKSE